MGAAPEYRQNPANIVTQADDKINENL